MQHEKIIYILRICLYYIFQKLDTTEATKLTEILICVVKLWNKF